MIGEKNYNHINETVRYINQFGQDNFADKLFTMGGNTEECQSIAAILQFNLQELKVVKWSNMLENDTGIITTQNSVYDEEIKSKGYRFGQLDDNEYVYAKGDYYINTLSEYGIVWIN